MLLTAAKVWICFEVCKEKGEFFLWLVLNGFAGVNSTSKTNEPIIV
jgi:hypothetical protein